MNAPVTQKRLVRSHNLSTASMENFRSGKQLDAELERLERERRSKLRELNQESKHFIGLKLRSTSARCRENSFSNGCVFPHLSPGREGCLSPVHGSRSPSASPPKSRSPSPSPRPIHFRKSLSTEESPKQTSPNSSPEAQKRLLSKRNSSPKPMGRSTSITETTVMPLLPILEKQIKQSPVGAIKTAEIILRSNASLMEARQSLIPQIVINDGSAITQQAERKSISLEVNRGCNIDTHDNRMKSTDGSLPVPPRSYRRNSLPSVPTPPSYLRSIAKKESTFLTEDAEDSDRHYKNRPRSSSVCVPYFSHLKDTPRRDSLLRKYVAKPGSYRRTAATLEKLISDLARGVHHDELLDGNQGSPGLSLEEWEKLKECRYLRMPSKDEDVIGNCLDVEEIFSHSENENEEKGKTKEACR